MALIQCPECMQTVSSQANTCPNCAFPLNKSVQQSKEGCFLRTLNIGCLIIAGLIGGFILLIIFILFYEN